MENYTDGGDSTSFPTILKRILDKVRSGDLKLRRRLSQHITSSPRVVKWILDSVDKNVEVLEVGSGTGILTYFLCRNTRRVVVAVEVDKTLAEFSASIVDCPNTVIIVGDILEVDVETRQIVSSVPYGISSKLLAKISRSNSVERAVLILQREVVDRIISGPGSGSYGRLSVMVRLLFNVVPGPVFPRSDFYPRPRVDSRGVILVRKRLYDEEVALIEDLTRAIFPYRRKILGGVVERVFKLEREELESIGLDPNRRVEELGEGDLTRLASFLRSRGLL
jgi:16S rRNA (adenine1518-N6/adenine1519-N6)-dimethyltransferase